MYVLFRNKKNDKVRMKKKKKKKKSWAQRRINLEIPEARFLNILGTS